MSALETSGEDEVREGETVGADYRPENGDSSDGDISLSSAGSALASVEELSDTGDTSDTECATSDDNFESMTSDSYSTILQEELPLTGASSKFHGILMGIRKDLVEFITQQPEKSLLPSKRLIRMDGKFRIRTGYGIQGDPKQLMHRILHRERRPDVVSCSSRAAEHFSFSDSHKTAMDALTLVCIAVYARVPLDFRALGPLLLEIRISEAAAPKKRHMPMFTQFEMYRLLRLYLLLGAYKIPGPLSLPARNVFICASRRNKNCLPLKWLSGQLNRDLIKRKDPFVAFTNALEYLNKKRVRDRIRWQKYRVVPTPQPIHVVKTPNTVKHTHSQLLPKTAPTLTCSNFAYLQSAPVKDEQSLQVSIAPTSTAPSIVLPVFSLKTE